MEMPPSNVKLRPANQADLDAVNRVVAAALMSWNLPERVKRLALPSYRYTVPDFAHLDIVVAEDKRQQVIGVAAWEQADARDLPEGQTALLLHGIYVDPSHHHRGVGRQLFRCAEQAVHAQQYGGLLVKAQPDADGFFLAQGMKRMQVADPARQYGNRFWKRASSRIGNETLGRHGGCQHDKNSAVNDL